jgi:plasmid replication initiation protein
VSKLKKWFYMTRKIYTRNDARPALIGMGLSAKRLLFMCLAQLERESSKDNVSIKFNADELFTITVKDYAELCEIGYTSAYRQVVEGIKELRSYLLEAEQGLLKKKEDNCPSDWIEPFTIANDGTGYSKGEGFVRIKFAKQMEPLISSLTSNFTGQFLLSAMQLPDGNAGKLYLILREWICSGFIVDKTITVDDFKDILGVSSLPSYSLYRDFNRSFFERSVKKLIEKTEFTDIKMEILERRMRNVYKVKISYQYDEKAINKRDKIVEKVLGKTEIKKPKKEAVQEVKDKSKESTLFFIEANHYLTREEAEQQKLNWNDGITAQELLGRLKLNK